MGTVSRGTRKPKAKRKRKEYQAPHADAKAGADNPGMAFASGGGNLLVQRAPEGMSQEEVEYRTLLQEAILWVSKQVLDEQRVDILKRAEERVKTLRELRG